MIKMTAYKIYEHCKGKQENYKLD